MLIHAMVSVGLVYNDYHLGFRTLKYININRISQRRVYLIGFDSQASLVFINQDT